MASIIPLLVLHILSIEAFIHQQEIPANSAYYSQRRYGKYSGEGRRNLNATTIFENEGDTGTPLFLTPYIESGKIEEAQKLAQVNLPGLPDLQSYAGFFTVDKTFNSNIFAWYFPAQLKGLATLVWLQGGPGASSLYGLFDENGPINVTNKEFKRRQVHWNSVYNLIYIDNPVGTGFSFTDDVSGYSTNQTHIGELLYKTMAQFYKLFPKLLPVPLFISGESYGGKHATSLAYTIHKKNPTAKARGDPVMPLAGVTIGDGWCDPVNQIGYGDLLYQAGLLSPNEYFGFIKPFSEDLQDMLQDEEWLPAFQRWNEIMSAIDTSMVAVSIYNYGTLLHPVDELACTYCELLNEDSTRKAIHVGNLKYTYLDDKATDYLFEDFMKSVAPWISELLEHYPMLFYNGQLDVIVGYSLTNNFLRHLDWSGKSEREKKERQHIFVPSQGNNSMIQVGFWKEGGNLTDVLIREAGHMAPADQSDWTRRIVEYWGHFFLHDSAATAYYGDKFENIKLGHL